VRQLLEVLVATVLLRGLAPRGGPLGSVGGLGRMLIAIGAGTAVSATVGSCSLLLGDVITRDDVPEVWRTWWLVIPGVARTTSRRTSRNSPWSSTTSTETGFSASPRLFTPFPLTSGQ
jgi:hypothetical protein